MILLQSEVFYFINFLLTTNSPFHIWKILQERERNKQISNRSNIVFNHRHFPSSLIRSHFNFVSFKNAFLHSFHSTKNISISPVSHSHCVQVLSMVFYSFITQYLSRRKNYFKFGTDSIVWLERVFSDDLFIRWRIILDLIEMRIRNNS